VRRGVASGARPTSFLFWRALSWRGVIAGLVQRARAFVPFFADDGFISLHYAARFMSGQGLTWTAGERVEGYSNLLWVLLTGVVGKLSGDYVFGARLCGIRGTPWPRLRRCSARANRSSIC
jgi:hypothetical protein